MKKILILGDSIGLPRNDRQVIDIDTWPSILMQKLCGKYIFFSQNFYAPTVSEILFLRNELFLGGFIPDIVLLQLGIVDCSPRCFLRKELQILKALGLGRIGRKIASKYHYQLTKIRKTTYVPQVSFKNDIIKLRNSFENATFYVLPIAPANSNIMSKSYGIANNINRYNAILQNIFGDYFLSELFGEMTNNLERLFDHDNIHLSRDGHLLVANILFSRLQSA